MLGTLISEEFSQITVLLAIHCAKTFRCRANWKLAMMPVRKLVFISQLISSQESQLPKWYVMMSGITQQEIINE